MFFIPLTLTPRSTVRKIFVNICTNQFGGKESFTTALLQFTFFTGVCVPLLAVRVFKTRSTGNHLTTFILSLNFFCLIAASVRARADRLPGSEGKKILQWQHRKKSSTPPSSSSGLNEYAPNKTGEKKTVR